MNVSSQTKMILNANHEVLRIYSKEVLKVNCSNVMWWCIFLATMLCRLLFFFIQKMEGVDGFIPLLCKITLRKRCFVCDDFIKNDFEFYGEKRTKYFFK